MDKKELAMKIKDAAFLEGDFLLRSGQRSKYYLDKYLFSAQPEILAELGKRFAEHAADADMIAGPELGAVGIAASTSMASGKPFAIVRKATKDYGTTKLIEGPDVKGKKVLLVEDIGTTAGAALQAAETLQKAGAIITKLVVTIDRLQGARENVEKAGLKFDSIITKEDMEIQ